MSLADVRAKIQKQFPIEKVHQPETEKMAIQDIEYPILAPGQTGSMAMDMAQDSMFELSAWDLPKVSMPRQGDTMWQIMTPEGPKSTEWLTGILVYFKEGYDFWAHAYGTEDTGPPDCSSVDGEYGYGDPGGACKMCPWFQWGSGQQINPQAGDRSKACRHSTRLFLIQHGSTTPTLIVAPPTSVKAMRRYAMYLGGMGLFVIGVESHLGLVPKQSGNFKVSELNLQVGRHLNNEQIKESYRMWLSFKAMFERNPRATQQEADTL
jgi:hypothetical protein